MNLIAKPKTNSNNKSFQKGFSVMEIMMALVVLSVVILTPLMVYSEGLRQQKRFEAIKALNLTKLSLLSYIQNAGSWTATSSPTLNSDMACLSSTSCANNALAAFPVGSPTPLPPTAPLTYLKVSLYDTSSNSMTTYDPNLPNSGFDLKGKPCLTYDAANGNDACPIKVLLTWGPADCTASSCPMPTELVKVRMSFYYTPKSYVSINQTAFAVNVIRPTN